MGGLITSKANSVGAVLGSAFAAPFKAIFGASCEGVCSGTWDVACFVEHLCFSSLLKFLLLLGLCFLILVFLYLVFKVGICQCMVRMLCKMSCALCKTYWSALEGVTCFLWYKLKNVKRVDRRHHRHSQDIEVGYSSREENKMLRKMKFNEGRRETTYRHGKHHHRNTKLKNKHRTKLKQNQTHLARHTNASKRRRII